MDVEDTSDQRPILERQAREDEDDGNNPVSFFQLFRFASKREKLAYSIASFISIVLGFVTPLWIYVFSRLTTTYIEEKNPIRNDKFLWRVWHFASLYCIGFFVSFILEYTQHFLLTWTSERLAQRCRRAFVEAILSRDTSAYDGRTGALNSQLGSHIDRMKEGLGDRIGLFVRSIASFIACASAAFILDWRTAFFLCWSGPVFALATILIPKLSTNATKRTLDTAEEANAISEECILNVKTVASCNGQKQMVERYASTLRSGVSAAVKVALSSGLLDATSNLIYLTFSCLGLWFATIAYHHGEVKSAGDVFAVVYLALAACNNFGRLGPHIITMQKAKLAAAKVYSIINSARDEYQEVGLYNPNLTVDVQVQFENVSFCYPNRDLPVIDTLSFDLQPGTSIGLVGTSGCGKSTTIKLLTRFLEADSGNILLNRIPLANYDKRKWRQMIGVVSQEPSLFAGTIRENICLGRALSEHQVDNACRIANAHDFISALDKGMDSMLGPSGVSLSGGQKQRIAIARAIVANPRLLLLDEATSALDTESERIVQEALDNASRGRSTVVIAHRLSTIRNVDQVIVMEKGRVVERGGYTELRAKAGGIFARMVEEQEMQQQSKSEKEIITEEESIKTVEENDANVDKIPEQIEEQTFSFVNGGLLALLFRNKCKTFIVILLGMLRGLIGPLSAARYLFVFDTLEEEHYETLLFWLMVGTAGVGIYNFIMQLVSQPICQYVGESIMNDVRVDCFRSLLNRPMAYFDRESTSPSAVAVLLSQQPQQAMSLIDNKLAIVVDGLFVCATMQMINFVVFLPVGIIGIFYLIFYLLLLHLLEKFSDRAYQSLVKADKSGEIMIEIINNVATIQQIAVESHFQTKYDEMQLVREELLARKIRFQSTVHATNQSIFFLFDFLATSIGVYFVYLGHYSAQMLFLAENILSTVGFKTVGMAESFKEMMTASSAAKILFSLIDPRNGPCEIARADNRIVPEGSLRAESLSFAYPSQPSKRIINDISFTVEEGKSVAFVGPSGGGKSTIVNLLERFYEPHSGHLLIGETSFSSLSPFELRSAVALVGQEPVLFRGTIADNVRLGVEGVSDEQVREACKLANAADFIEDSPQGYLTVVGAKGGMLSGGQKQRIAIARALVRNPKVIVLDEATSALDTQSEKAVRAALESSARGRTSVMIAHRLDTIRHCDEICYVESGKIVERGSHTELIAKRGRYYRLTMQQNMN